MDYLKLPEIFLALLLLASSLRPDPFSVGSESRSGHAGLYGGRSVDGHFGFSDCRWFLSTISQTDSGLDESTHGNLRSHAGVVNGFRVFKFGGGGDLGCVVCGSIAP